MKPSNRTKTTTSKKPAARSEVTGRFETDPYADPALMDDLVRYVRAIRDIEPLLSGVVLMYKTMGGHEQQADAVAFLGLLLANLKQEALRSLSVDPEARREVKKLRVQAGKLGNLPIEEQQRVQQMARDWLLDVPLSPAKLATSAPGVLDSIMRSVAAVMVEGGPAALSERVPSPDIVDAQSQLVAAAKARLKGGA
jgi:hypothetical protein